jgi:hypothetical protein
VAPLLPKLRGHFAEFLNKDSPVRLRILSQPTCVGLRYGYHKHSIAAFLASVKSFTSLLIFSVLPRPMLTGMRTSLHTALGASTQLTITALELSFCVTASIFMVVQESPPAIHRLRLSSSA